MGKRESTNPTERRFTWLIRELEENFKIDRLVETELVGVSKPSLVLKNEASLLLLLL